MNIFEDEERLYIFLVWLLSFLLACTVSSIILFIEPSYPIAILFAQIIEIFLFAQIFIYVKRINNALQVETVEPVELYDIETRTNIQTRYHRGSIREQEDT